MSVLLAYVAAAVVVGLMIGFVTLVLLWTAKVVGKNIRERSLSLLSTYDSALEARSRRLAELDEAIHAREAEVMMAAKGATEPAAEAAASPAPAADPSILLRAAERLSAASYLDGSAGRSYRDIHLAFRQFDPARELARHSGQSGASPAGGPASRLLRELSGSTLYQLSTLPAEEQLEVLEASLPAEGRELLAAYSEEHSGAFDCVVFHDWLLTLAALEPAAPELRVPPDLSAAVRVPPGVRVTADSGICEGFEIEADGVLYDYCIRTREIG